MITLLWIMLAGWSVPGGSMRGPHHPRGHYHHQPRANTKLTQDTELLRDVEHIREDLGDWGISKDDVQKLTPEELDFHYFKLHDFDNNTKLDGLEILQAIHHTVHKEDEHEKREGEAEGSGGHGHGHEAKVAAEDDFPYFVELIDQVLAEDDQDNDGYLSYVEYVIGKQREQTKEEKVQRSLRSNK